MVSNEYAALPARNSRGLALQLAEHIASSTASMPPNTRLGTKTELRAQWGVAAATLNEALRLLQARGAVTLRTGPEGGVFVAEPPPLVRIGQALMTAHGNPTAVVDAVTLREALDPLTVVEASRFRTRNDVRALRRQIRRLRKTIDDDTAFPHQIWDLHRMIVNIGRNDILREVSLGLLEIVASNTRSVAPGTKSLVQREHRIAVHEALVGAIESGDPEQCAAASKAHEAAGPPPGLDTRRGGSTAHA